MKNSVAIRLLASTNNDRGDLFTRLIKDLFFALGYDDLRLDVHKSGRELDIQGKHRFEPRLVVAECKAHASKMGGEDLNKFFGALERERRKCIPTAVAGYFVSLSGFTETGIEQELETGDDRIILLDAQKVVSELERCRAVVGRTEAAERAGRCAQEAGLRGAVLDDAEFLGHQSGYVWTLYYAGHKERTHVSLVAADGTPLAEGIAKEIIEADRFCGGSLHRLQYLAPPALAPDRLAQAAKAVARHRQWLAEECGYIHLDGLPADADLSVTRLRLERLFVPLKAVFLPDLGENLEAQEMTSEPGMSIGEMLRTTSRLALLAMPGGGKSTLLKRLATAYAFPERRSEVSDDLPQCEWLPLILRCRELRDRAHRPIIELLDNIPLYAGMDAGEADAFRETIHSGLRNGHILLLIDGLDEISDEGSRQAFAKHLRTFLAMFPQAALIVTSREAGFRQVAGVVASACEQARLAPLDLEDVRTLCERWHVEVIADTDKVRAEAKELAQTIWSNERIRPLIENPLLLTTLLVVKRWIGELPRNRTGLYREAIRVLVRTWNVEGYVPLDEDETLAQLSYVACAMMEQGKQQIGEKELLKLLQSARRELEAELQFTRISPQEFVERIELRSSLLMQVGFERMDVVLQPVYEFRHLTFQEYLAARGYVEEQHRGRDGGQSLANLLEPHFWDETWQEVIPLAAVIAGRRAEELIGRLIAASESDQAENASPKTNHSTPATLLFSCIRDEVQITAPTLKGALLELAAHRQSQLPDAWEFAIMQGKFGDIFRETIEGACLATVGSCSRYLSAWAEVSAYTFERAQPLEVSEPIVDWLIKILDGTDRIERIRAALVMMKLAYSTSPVGSHRTGTVSELSTQFQRFVVPLARMVVSDDLWAALAASWAFAWMGRNRLLVEPPAPEFLQSLYRLWRRLEPEGVGDLPRWALAEQRLLPRDTFSGDAWGDCDLFLQTAVSASRRFGGSDQCAAVLVGWYRRSPWTDAELVEQLRKLAGKRPTINPTVREMLETFGEPGCDMIKKIEEKSKSKSATK